MLSHSFQAYDEVIGPAHKFYLSFGHMNSSWEEAGEESVAYLYVRNSFQDLPYVGSLSRLQT